MGKSSDIVLRGKDKQPPIVGGRLLQMLDRQLRALRDAPAHGNRELHADHVVVAHLIAFFNPVVASLRTVEDVFEHDQVRQRLKLPRVPKSTLSDAQRLFDLSLLQPLIKDLAGRIDIKRHPDLKDLVPKIVAVDATVFQVASRIAWASPRNSRSSRSAVQVCFHLDLDTGSTDGFSIIGGQQSERTELPESLKPGRLYLLDRAYQSYDHLNRIVATNSDFVVRLRSAQTFSVVEDRPLTLADRRVAVRSDTVVTPASDPKCFKMPVRLIEIQNPGEDKPVRLLTNRMDLSAETIGLLYRHRWQVELYFRWLKCVTGLKHFFSESQNGMALQLYIAVIGTLLIALEADAHPSKYDFTQMSLVASGMLNLDNAKEVMARRRAERARAAEQQKKYRENKKNR